MTTTTEPRCTTCDAYGMDEPATTTEHPVVNDGLGGMIRDTDAAPIAQCDDCARIARRYPLDSMRARDLMQDPRIARRDAGNGDTGTICRLAVKEDPGATVEDVRAAREE